MRLRQLYLISSSAVVIIPLQFDGIVNTFGYGSDHDASLLKAISDEGDGVYYYIESNEKVHIPIIIVALRSF